MRHDEATHLVWDLFLEGPTLGGALVLRQEGEYIAREKKTEKMQVHLRAPNEHTATGQWLATMVFGSSAIPASIVATAPPADAWPLERIRSRPGFSYFSFERVLEWYMKSRQPPRLAWSADCRDAAVAARTGFRGRLMCLHLKYLPPYIVEESNADPHVWKIFLERNAVAGELDFLLLGNDVLPDALLDTPGVSSATALGIDLPTQLCLVGMADGFLGTASGMATTANFSAVPHVLFKHPTHHPLEMNRQLGSADRMPFALPNQQLWRRITTPEVLDEALALILG